MTNSIAINYLFLVAIGLIQLLAPVEKYGLLKREWKLDLLWVFLGVELLPRALGWIHIAPSDWIFTHAPVILNLSRQPWWIQFAIALVISDFLHYWTHRIIHEVPFLWELHKAHHSTTQMTAISSDRNGYLDDLIETIVTVAPLRLLGIDFAVLGALGLLLNLASYILHANLKFGTSPSRWICTPSFHRWHHAKKSYFRAGQNFGGLFSFWDCLFGTAHLAKTLPEALGFEGEENYPPGFFARWIYPLRFTPRATPQQQGPELSGGCL